MSATSGSRNASAGLSSVTVTAAEASVTAAEVASVTAAEAATLMAQKTEMLAAAQLRMEQLLSTYMIPVTIPQREQWLDERLPEFRGLMATAPAERRQRSLRLRARDGMPAAVKRMQPLQATNDGVRADWACNLRLRTGWHVLKTRGHGNLFVFMIVLHNVTYYIDLGNESSVGKRPRCHMDTVCIDSLIHELAHLETLLADDEVCTVCTSSMPQALLQGTPA